MCLWDYFFIYSLIENIFMWKWYSCLLCQRIVLIIEIKGASWWLQWQSSSLISFSLQNVILTVNQSCYLVFGRLAWNEVVITWLLESRQKPWSILLWPLKRKHSEALLQGPWTNREESHLPRGSARLGSWQNNVCICHLEYEFTIQDFSVHEHGHTNKTIWKMLMYEYVKGMTSWCRCTDSPVCEATWPTVMKARPVVNYLFFFLLFRLTNL